MEIPEQDEHLCLVIHSDVGFQGRVTGTVTRCSPSHRKEEHKEHSRHSLSHLFLQHASIWASGWKSK